MAKTLVLHLPHNRVFSGLEVLDFDDGFTIPFVWEKPDGFFAYDIKDIRKILMGDEQVRPLLSSPSHLCSGFPQNFAKANQTVLHKGFLCESVVSGLRVWDTQTFQSIRIHTDNPLDADGEDYGANYWEYFGRTPMAGLHTPHFRVLFFLNEDDHTFKVLFYGNGKSMVIPISLGESPDETLDIGWVKAYPDGIVVSFKPALFILNQSTYWVGLNGRVVKLYETCSPEYAEQAATNPISSFINLSACLPDKYKNVQMEVSVVCRYKGCFDHVFFHAVYLNYSENHYEGEFTYDLDESYVIAGLNPISEDTLKSFVLAIDEMEYDDAGKKAGFIEL